MSEPFVSQIAITSFGFAIRGWARCDGQLLPIAQNQALFALLGTTFGGNGLTTFALPDLRGRFPMHPGNGHTQGEKAGALTAAFPPGSTTTACTPGGADPQAGETIAPLKSSAPAGQLDLMPPYLALTFQIALQGIFPTRD